MKKDLITLRDLEPKDVDQLIEKSLKVKNDYIHYARRLFEKVLLMIFEAPSLRTRLSFETAMTQMHGHAVNYYTIHSPWGAGKESIEDVGKVISRYCDIVSARIYSHEELVKLAKNASIPIINAMTNDGHPCQVLGDLLTIHEKLNKHKHIKIAYLGDAENNVTYSLMRAAALTKSKVAIACPSKEEYQPKKKILTEVKRMTNKYGGSVSVHAKAEKAVKDADIVYTDSWMSYRIAKEEKAKRKKDLKNYQVNRTVFNKAKKKALFMHCLPAKRGHEVTAQVIDSKRSIVFDQAENRLHMEKALLLQLLGR